MAGGIKNFVAEVWDARLEYFLAKTFIFGDIVNTDYEGEIEGIGSLVRVNTLTDINVKDYDEDVDIVPDSLDSLQTTFEITESAYWASYVKSIDQALMPANIIDTAMQSAAYGMKDKLDKYILNLGYDNAGLKFEAGAAQTLNAKDVTGEMSITQFFARLNRRFDEAELPTIGRWCTITPWMYEKMVLAKILTDTNNSSILNNGVVGNYLGWTLKRSNNIPTSGSNAKVLAGVGTTGITFAYKPVETSTFEHALRFGKGMKQLVVFGGKVMRPDFLMAVTVTEGAEGAEA